MSQISLWSDLLVGVCSGLLISPLNTVIDKSIIQYMNEGKDILKQSTTDLKLFLRQPLVFMSSIQFKLMFGVYASTYFVSNMADHVSVTDSLSQPIQKLLAVFVVNSALSIVKDRIYIRHFSSKKMNAVPLTTYGFWFTRDIIAMAAAFTIPPIVGTYIAQHTAYSQSTGYILGQLGCPIIFQFVLTPIHLAGLDCYERNNVSIKQRIELIKDKFPKALLFRIMRFLPAYGFGGVFNTHFKEYMRRKPLQ